MSLPTFRSEFYTKKAFLPFEWKILISLDKKSISQKLLSMSRDLWVDDSKLFVIGACLNV